MSLEVCDIQSDGGCEEVVDESFRFSEDFLGKKTGLKRTVKPPASPKSPYLTSLNVNPHRAAVAAWRLPRASLGGSKEDSPGETGPGRPLSLSNGHDLSRMIRAECAVSPDLFKKNFRKQQKLLQSAAAGFSASEFRDKEDMYDEIIHLKKSLQEHKCDNKHMKAKVRRLEEDNAKRKKQIQELLDPTKGSDFVRSLVDNRGAGSVVVNGLKQRILKLEQQCREKENALSKLQSELRTTKLAELKVTVETYFEEIHRLKTLLEAADKRYAAKSKSWQRQQRALNCSIQHLTQRNTLLQQENEQLSEELSTVPPTAGLTGYKEWSKKRLLRRVVELERRHEDKKIPAPAKKSIVLLDQETQTAASEAPDRTQPFTMATEAGITVATMTEERAEESELRGRLSQWEQEGAELQEALRERDEELAQVKMERAKCEKEMDEWKAEQTSGWDQERQQLKQELEVLWTKLQALEEERDREALTAQEQPVSRGTVQSDTDSEELQKLHIQRKESAARVIQRQWRKHRDRDVVLLQSALRGHLHRDAQLKAKTTEHCDTEQQTNGLQDLNSLILVQSALRGHLTRSRETLHSSGIWESSGVGGFEASLRHQDDSQPQVGAGCSVPSSEANLHRSNEAAENSDDSDDIIISPSHPIRKVEVPFT